MARKSMIEIDIHIMLANAIGFWLIAEKLWRTYVMLS